MKETTQINCPECNILFFPLMDRKHNQSKHNKRFCSKSCRMIYFNKNFHINKGCKRNVSYPEDLLLELIKTTFMSLSVNQSDRQTLKSQLEIDISIPSLKLAIEINGPVHYFPVFGESKFEDIKQKDNQKFRELNDMGYSFLVINVSMITSRKKQTEFINQIFQETVKPLIESKMVPL